MKAIHLLSSVALLAAVGCVNELGEEELGRSRLGYTLEECIVPAPVGIREWGAPVSLEHPTGSLWIWESLVLEDGTQLRNAAAFVKSVDQVCNGDMEFASGPEGNLISIIALTPEEEAENSGRTDGRELQLRCTGGFVHEGRGYLYYEKVLAGPGLFDSVVLGMGICLSDEPLFPCERTMPDRYPSDPALMWDRTERIWNRGGFVAQDGYAYLFGCIHAAAFEDLCGVARVLPADAGDPFSYRYYNELDGWKESPWDATVVFEEAGRVTPFFSAYLGRYVAVTTNIWESSVEARLSRRPFADFEEKHLLFDAIHPKGWFIGGGSAHAAMSPDGGRSVAVTYFTDADSGYGLHLVSFGFDPI